MMHLLDTNVVIGLRDGDKRIEQRIAHMEELPVVSVVTRIELEGGLIADPLQRDRWLQRLDVLLKRLTVLPFDDREAQAYRAIIMQVGFSRPRVLDRMIAAQALCVGATLVTANVRDFRDIPGLEIEDWSA